MINTSNNQFNKHLLSNSLHDIKNKISNKMVDNDQTINIDDKILIV